MPEPLRPDRRYMPGLDGVRAIAVLGVFAYHLGIGAIPGGFLGVSVFFTLSGYLITDLILSRQAANEFTLRSFWVARGRRLLPAMFILILGVAAWVTVIGPRQSGDFRAAALASALYVNNWWQVAHDVSYFAQFDQPGALNHLWSLAVEEQFYIVWPLVLLGLARIVRERSTSVNRPRLAAAIAAIAAASTIAMLVMYQPGGDPTRVYYGTDTRASELLVGAALAAIWPSARLRAGIRPGARNVLDAAALGALVLIAVLFVTVNDSSSFPYRGGFVLLSLAVAALVAALAHPASRLAAIVGCRPMRWIGARSYGIYLWHFPVIALSNPPGETALHPVRTPLQVLVSFCLAAVSWQLLEEPIRHGALGRLWALRHRPNVLRRRFTDPQYLTALVATVIIVVPAVAGLAGAGVRSNDTATAMEANLSETVTVTEPSSSGIDDPTGNPDPTDTSIAEPTTSGVPESTAASATTTSVAATTTTVRSTQTSCTEIVHIGDSTSTGLIGKKYLKEDEAIPAQYARVGVTKQHFEIAGGRSIEEGYKTARPAKRSAEKWENQGFSGCWVLALGTMDAAAVAKGIRPGLRSRIQTMMDIVGNDPVMWVNLKGRRSGGPWGAKSLANWNKMLLSFCEKYPNMRIYNWAGDVKKTWYISDGIHQNTEGYRYRAQFIADALAQAFPVDVRAAGTACVVDI